MKSCPKCPDPGPVAEPFAGLQDRRSWAVAHLPLKDVVLILETWSWAWLTSRMEEMTRMTLWQQRQRGNNKEILENEKDTIVSNGQWKPSRILMVFFVRSLSRLNNQTQRAAAHCSCSSCTWGLYVWTRTRLCKELYKSRAKGLTLSQRRLLPSVFNTGDSRWTQI